MQTYDINYYFVSYVYIIYYLINRLRTLPMHYDCIVNLKMELQM